MQFDKDMKSPHKKLFLSVREMILNFKGVEEIKKDKITTYSFNGSGLCHLRTMPHGVDIGLLKGAFIKDKFGLLHGETKRMRIFSLEKFLSKELKYYIGGAIELNS